MVTVEKKASKMNFKDIQRNDRLSGTYYLDVLSVDKAGGIITVQDQNGQKFDIRGKGLIEQTLYSGNKYEKEEKISRTEAVNILRNAGDTVFTVRFEKQDGKMRDLTGHLINSENEFGRSNVIDLNITSGHNQRQIDHRTISWIVFKNVKYTVK